jgi:hypothetical protein
VEWGLLAHISTGRTVPGRIFDAIKALVFSIALVQYRFIVHDGDCFVAKWDGMQVGLAECLLLGSCCLYQTF